MDPSFAPYYADLPYQGTGIIKRAEAAFASLSKKHDSIEDNNAAALRELNGVFRWIVSCKDVQAVKRARDEILIRLLARCHSWDPCMVAWCMERLFHSADIDFARFAALSTRIPISHIIERGDVDETRGSEEALRQIWTWILSEGRPSLVYGEEFLDDDGIALDNAKYFIVDKIFGQIQKNTSAFSENEIRRKERCTKMAVSVMENFTEYSQHQNDTADSFRKRERDITARAAKLAFEELQSYSGPR